ncbi:MAG: DNA-binding protein [Rhodoferax sp.]
MARSGIYKSEVVRARDNLIAQGRHPSIDAVRVELGNTGSKVTIHRYLKEIEEDESAKAKGRGVAISEALQSLTQKLAEQLQDEADQRVLQLKSTHAEELQTSQDALQTAQSEILALKQRLSEAQKEAAAEKCRYEDLHAAFIGETQARNKAEQRATDLQLQLESEVGHRAAAEGKYVDARRALEHFRDASREQREQEARQHDNQVQFLQHEIHGLKESLTLAQLKSAEAFQELARLTTELGGARRELAQQEKLKGQIQSLNERLMATQSQRDLANNQLEHERQQTSSLRLELEKETGLRLAAAGRIQELGGELLAMKVQLETSERVTEQIRLQVSKIIGEAAGKSATH